MERKPKPNAKKVNESDFVLQEIKRDDKSWLNQAPEPSEIENNQYGGYFIPIEKLRPLLDRLNASTRNFTVSMYKDGNIVCAYGSLELTVTIDGEQRTVVGAYNLPILDAPNGYWNGTLKSDCIKNAALELGARFGRDLNKGIIQEPVVRESRTVKLMPDTKIMQKYQDALNRGDEAAIAMIKNIYQIES